MFRWLTLPISILTTAISLAASNGIFYLFTYSLTYAYLKIVHYISGRRFDLYDFSADDEPEKNGFLVPPEEWHIETPQRSSFKNNDDVYCFGVNSGLDFLFLHISRKSDNKVKCCIYLRLSDGRVFTLPEEHSLQPEIDDPHSFGSPRLKMECLSPLRKWRVFFNGILKEASAENGNPVYKHVKFAFLWTASSDVFDFTSDISLKALAAQVADQKLWTWPSILLAQRLKNILDGYEQPGMFLGTVAVEDEPEKEVYLWGARGHFMGELADIDNGDFCHLFANAKNGILVQIVKLHLPGIISDFTYGFVMQTNGYIFPIDENYKEVNETDNEMKVSCCAGGQKYFLHIKINNSTENIQNNDLFRSITSAKIFVNSIDGNGIITEGKITKDPLARKSPNLSPSYKLYPQNFPTLCVSLDDPYCQLIDVSGGKGSSLGKLTSICPKSSGKMGSLQSEFSVPKGIVVTTAAYQEFIRGALEQALHAFEQAVWSEGSDSIHELCHRMVEKVCKTELPSSVNQSIIKKLKKVFGAKFNEMKFAVRSSATGEDTDQMSAAGQMDTFLGTKGVDEILTAVKKCWASQFAFIAVKYKRQYGQLLNTPMAVVIQEMVPCDVAGVLFTCDPVTGNPFYIRITANYGLGESVVSASAEPDTVTLHRDIHNQLKYDSQQLGSKKSKIVMKGTEGTEEVEIDEAETSKGCLSEQMALKLGYLAIKIEGIYGKPVDIEWGILNDNIFLLQTRPITSIDVDSDFEIMHHFDCYMRREDEYLSKANVGEVISGAVSTLCIDFSNKMFEDALWKQKFVDWGGEALPKVPYYIKRMVYVYNHAFFCLADAFFKFSEEGEKGSSDHTKALTIAIFGRIIEDENITAMAIDRHKKGAKKDPGTSIISKLYIFYLMFFAGYHSRKIAKKLANYYLPIKSKNALDIFNVIACNYNKLYEAMNSHLDVTFSSPFWNLSTLSLLVKEHGEWNNDVYSDYAYLLSSLTKVESADVPAAMQSLGYTIAKCIDPQKFKDMDEEEALKWLQTSNTEAATKFSNFLEAHGHRCLNEFDVYSHTWAMNPKSLVKTLQNLAIISTEDVVEKKSLSFNTIFENLHAKLGFISRLKLRFLVPQCQRGVRDREISKSVLVKAIDKLRKGFYCLAEAMVKEGRLPNKELLFFLNVEEVKQLLKTRSPKLVAKAFRRWKYHPIMSKFIFPETFSGFPRPINTSEDVEVTEDFCMTGVPVSRGVIKGIARVVLYLEDAPNIQKGDILIAYSTDIGWSPYFPLLSGVVTELGGLVSHGAVVAREYGLPCVVNLRGATRYFKSGDLVLLDGNKGILKKLKSVENNI